jgi:hypothetical protein
MHNLDARQTLLEAAQNFDQLAEQADARRKTELAAHTSDG